MKLDFNEANILIQNFHSPDKDILINQLTQLGENTTDIVLKDSALSLRDKIFELSEQRLFEIYEDLRKGNIISTKQYNL